MLLFATQESRSGVYTYTHKDVSGDITACLAQATVLWTKNSLTEREVADKESLLSTRRYCEDRLYIIWRKGPDD